MMVGFSNSIFLGNWSIACGYFNFNFLTILYFNCFIKDEIGISTLVFNFFNIARFIVKDLLKSNLFKHD